MNTYKTEREFEALGEEIVIDEEDLRDKIEDELDKKNSGQPSQKVYLYRGCYETQIIEMVKMGSAEGKISNPNVKRPNIEACNKQVGEDPVNKVPEFTTKFCVANGFGGNGVVGLFEIDTKYLRQGSTAEGYSTCS